MRKRLSSLEQFPRCTWWVNKQMVRWQWQASYQKRPREKKNSKQLWKRNHLSLWCHWRHQFLTSKNLKKRVTDKRQVVPNITRMTGSNSVKRQTVFHPCWLTELFENQQRQNWRELEHTLAGLQRGSVGYCCCCSSRMDPKKMPWTLKGFASGSNNNFEGFP